MNIIKQMLRIAESCMAVCST